MCKSVEEGGARCAAHTRDAWDKARGKATADRERAQDTGAYLDQLTKEVAGTPGWTPLHIDLDRVKIQTANEAFRAEASARVEHAALVEYAGTPSGREAIAHTAGSENSPPEHRRAAAKALTEADDRARFSDQATVQTRVAPDVSRMSRTDFNKSVKKALKERSGKQWSVTGSSGTGYGWITVTAPKSRLRDGYYMTDEDCAELGHLLGHDRPVSYQGESTSPDNWQALADRAHTGATSNYKPASWD